MNRQQHLQDGRYDVPYHYIPEVDDSGFSQTRHWSWGYRYLGRLAVACDLLAEAEFDSLMDIGCGDGRFLREVGRRWTGARLLGVDISSKAIALASALNPDLAFEVRDITRTAGGERFDVVTLLDVIEHVAPPNLGRFIESASDLVRPGGRLVLTVPHRNAPVTPQHHQHFDSGGLIRLLEPAFDDVRVVPFDHASIPLRVMAFLLGASGQHFVITHRGINGLFYRYYVRRCLRGAGESCCRRLAAIARRR